MSDDPDRSIDSLFQEENVASDAQLREATLAGIPGVGVLQVVRGGGGGVHSVDGTWRLAAGDDRDTSALERAHAGGETVRYRGVLHDPERPRDETPVELEVRITSVQSYRLDELGDDDERGPERTYVNFDLAGELPPVGSL